MDTTLGAQLAALSHRPQRQMLIQLLHHNPRDDSPVGSDDPDPENGELEVLLDFQNYHLPELEKEGFIDYNREDNIVTKGPNFEEIKPHLQLIDEHSDELPDEWV